MRWYNNNVYNRHIAHNNTSGKDMYLEILSHNDGSGVVNTGGSVTNNKNLTTVTPSTGSTYVAIRGGKYPETSTNVVHRSGAETIDGAKTFTQDINFRNSYLDLTATPSSNTYSNFIFRDKNNKTLSYLQYGKQTSGKGVVGLYLYDSSQVLHGLQVTLIIM